MNRSIDARSNLRAVGSSGAACNRAFDARIEDSCPRDRQEPFSRPPGKAIAGSSMLKIQRKANGDVVVTLSGPLQADNVGELSALLADEQPSAHAPLRAGR